MNSKKIKIIKNFFSKSFTDEELKNLFLWFNSKKGYKEIIDSLDKNWESFEYNDTQMSMDSSKMLRKIKNGIQSEKTIQLKNNFTKFLHYASLIAIIIGFTAIIIYIFNNKPSKKSYSDFYTSIITESGQRSKVVLPDSSIVWLNSSTTLSYNYSFKDKRIIFLNGQAFFQVTRNENRPFLVQCGDIKIKVLGTKFDVNGYPENDKISVVLESGSVLLSQGQGTLNYKLTPGEEADYDICKKDISIHDTDVKKYTSWKDGKLIFRNDPMKLVLKKLERWYNIKIEVKDSEVYNTIFTGTINNESYQQIFKLIEYSCSVNCDIQTNLNSEEIPKIIISNKSNMN